MKREGDEDKEDRRRMKGWDFGSGLNEIPYSKE